MYLRMCKTHNQKICDFIVLLKFAFMGFIVLTKILQVLEYSTLLQYKLMNI